MGSAAVALPGKATKILKLMKRKKKMFCCCDVFQGYSLLFVRISPDFCCCFRFGRPSWCYARKWCRTRPTPSTVTVSKSCNSVCRSFARKRPTHLMINESHSPSCAATQTSSLSKKKASCLDECVTLTFGKLKRVFGVVETC